MTRILALGAVCAALLAAAPAAADTLTPRAKGDLGLGVDAALNLIDNGGLASGLSGRYQVSPDLGLQGIFRFDYTGGPGDASSTYVNVGLRALYNLASADHASFGFVGGVTIASFGVDSGVEGVDGQSELGVSLEGGLRAEYFVTKSFSFHGDFGLVIASLGGEDLNLAAIPGAPQGTTLALDAGDLLGSAGFTFWF